MVLHDKQLPDLCGLKQWKYIPESQVDRLMQFSHSIYINLFIIIWLGFNCAWPGYARLIWALGLRTGSGQLQNFYSRTRAEEVMTFWGMLISWQRKEDFKNWHQSAMPLKVSDWSRHPLTSACVPLSQVRHKTYPKSLDSGRTLCRSRTAKAGREGRTPDK